jgi:hypothetical protein
MAEADLGQVGGAVQADRNVADQARHVIAHAGVPAHGKLRMRSPTPQLSCSRLMVLVKGIRLPWRNAVWLPP